MKNAIYFIVALGMLASCQKDETQYDASGVFEVTEVTVSAQASGEIRSLQLKEGDTLTAGSEVGYIDDTGLRLSRNQLNSETARLKAGRDQAEAARKQAEAASRQTEAQSRSADARKLNQNQQSAAIRQQIENLRHEEARFRALVAKGAASQKQVDDIVQQIAVLEKQLLATDEQIGTANTGIELGGAAYQAQREGFGAQAEGFSAQARGYTAQTEGVEVQRAIIDNKISHTRINCPISGTVLAKYMEAGEYATVGRPLFKVGNLNEIVLRAYVTAEQVTKLKVGQRCTVYADQGASGRKSYNGTITWISDRAEFTPRTIQTRDERANLVYAVKVSVRNDGLIKRGMYGDVKF